MSEGKIRVVFDGPPGQRSGRFVEVEDETGKSIRLGEWVQDGSYWYLEFDDLRARIAEARARLEDDAVVLDLRIGQHEAREGAHVALDGAGRV